MEIELKNLSKTYESADGLTKVNAVDNISLTIPSNEIFGIIGRSGAGKSSLVRLVSMMERPDSGEVLYDGVRVDNLNVHESYSPYKGVRSITRGGQYFFRT